MLEEQISYKIETNLSNNTVSICRVSTILKDSIFQSSSNLREAFSPNQIEDVKSFMGIGDDDPTIIYLNSLWTAEVIQDYNDMLAALAAAEMG